MPKSLVCGVKHTELNLGTSKGALAVFRGTMFS
jgi:hypothetical protein